MSQSDDNADKKKGGFFKRAFGLKSKEEKLAEEAAERAAQQKLVDEQMAARMAAINAAALKSAREQDEKATGIQSDAEEKARIEAEEKKRAQEQAKKDVEAAKRLAEEKRRAAEKAEAERLKAEADRLEAERIAAEKAKVETDAAKQAAADAAQKQAEAKAAEEKAKKEKAKKDAEDAEEKARLATEQARIAKEAEQKAKAAQQEQEKSTKEAAAKSVAEPIETPKTTPPAPTLAPPPTMDSEPKEGFLDRISKGLRKSTSRMSENMSAMFNKRKLDDAALEDLQDLLIASDLGVGPAMKVTESLAKDKFDKQVTDMEIKIALADVISDILTPLEKPLILTETKPQVLLFVGVNGSGKTTTLGKIAKRYTDEGKKVLMAAGDTFRAAAVEQLKIWGERSGAPVMSAKLGADAAGLVYDAIERAKREDFDIVMIDTAGRLQNRTELMDELAKIVRVIKKHDPSAPHHSVLVLDATVGQNALSQTEAFKSTADVSGLIMTKLDGTAKGGVLVALSDKFALPIHAIGIGERIEDLENFSAAVFAAALSGVADAMTPSVTPSDNETS